MKFADNLRKFRKQKGWTQSDLGEKCGINPKTLSSYEQGRTEPNLGEIVKLCNAFDCSIAELTGTKERIGNNMTAEDILIQLNDFDDVDTLKRIEKAVRKIIQIRVEKENLLLQKKQMEARLKEYAQKIIELDNKLKGDD